MLIQHSNTAKEGAFFVKEGDELLAKMTYTWAGEHLFIIDHTEVSEKLEGKGVGKQLVAAAVEFARSGQHKIIPLCPFANRVFEKTADYNDVRHHLG